MNFSKLVPSVFYIDISDGLKLFVDCLKFSMEHQDLVASQPYCVLEKNGIRIMVFQDEQLAKEHYPELRLETDNIEAMVKTVFYWKRARSMFFPAVINPFWHANGMN